MVDSTAQVDIGAAEAFADGQRSAFFSGLLDEVYIFDQALLAAGDRSDHDGWVTRQDSSRASVSTFVRAPRSLNSIRMIAGA